MEQKKSPKLLGQKKSPNLWAKKNHPTSRRLTLDTFVGTAKTRIVIADMPLLDQDGRGGVSEQPDMDIPQAEKNL